MLFLLDLEEPVTCLYPVSSKSSPHLHLFCLLASFIYGQDFLLTLRIKLCQHFVFLPCVLHIPSISCSFGYHLNNIMVIIIYSVTRYVPACNFFCLSALRRNVRCRNTNKTDRLESYNPKLICKTPLPFTVRFAGGGDTGCPYLTYIVSTRNVAWASLPLHPYLSCSTFAIQRA
jgi:hypothetical protein